MASTPYDDVFRTLLNDCTALAIPVVNEVFHENFTGTEEVIFAPNEHFINRQDGEESERITDSCFIIMAGSPRKYHIECQSTPDSSLLVRIFEYDAQIALDGGSIDGNMLEVSFPHSAVLFLRHNRATPDTMQIRITAPGGSLVYGIPAIKLQEYTLDRIFGKKLLFLLPFYIFSHESRFDVYEHDDAGLERLQGEYAYIRENLEALCRQQAIDEYTKCMLIDMSNKVLEHLAAGHGRVMEGVKAVMGGKVLDYEAKRIKNEGFEQGKQQALIELVREGVLTVEDAAKRLHKKADEIKLLL